MGGLPADPPEYADYYRVIDKFGKTLDFMLSEHRAEAAATTFFTRVIGNNGFPDRVVIDKRGGNLAGLQNMNSC
jgi:putative transposase